MRAVFACVVLLACRASTGTADAGPPPAPEARVEECDAQVEESSTPDAIVVVLHGDRGYFETKLVDFLERLDDPLRGPRCVANAGSTAVDVHCLHAGGSVADHVVAVDDGVLVIDGKRSEPSSAIHVRAVRTTIPAGPRSDVEHAWMDDRPEARCAGITPTKSLSAYLVTRAEPDRRWSVFLDVPALHVHSPFVSLWQMHACTLRVEDRRLDFDCESGEGTVGSFAVVRGHTLYATGSEVPIPCDANLKFLPRNPCKQFPAMGACNGPSADSEAR